MSTTDIATTSPNCVRCGWRSDQPVPPPVRRTISVLFVDIVGFTGLVDRLSPEQAWALQTDYFDVVSDVVRAAGGVVEKYVGDAVLAVFGVDRTDEHDAYRAVAAGLRIQELLDGRTLAGGHAIRTRVGIATGEAMVDPSAARDGGHAMLSGNVVTTAARLQAYAPHGTVVVCGYTRHATASVVAYQDLPPVSVAGRAKPLDLWRALPRRAQRTRRATAPVSRATQGAPSGPMVTPCGSQSGEGSS